MAGDQGSNKPGWNKGDFPLVVVIVAGIMILGLFRFILPFIEPTLAIRDAGGFAGGGDFGGGGGYSGSGSYGGGGYSGGGSGGASTVFDMIGLAITLPFWVAAGLSNVMKGGNGGGGSSKPAGASPMPSSRLRNIGELQVRDPKFSALAVEELYANVYVRMQECWTAGDFEPMRPYFSNQLFGQFSHQLASLRAKGQTNYVDNIAVLETNVRGWYETQTMEYLIMKVRTRITDYTVEDATGELVGGSKTKNVFMEYEYQLQRPKGELTDPEIGQTTAKSCPNCGAALDMAQNARCPYCGTVVESSQHGWVIASIKGISKQTR